jgi:hypothetical protein
MLVRLPFTRKEVRVSVRKELEGLMVYVKGKTINPALSPPSRGRNARRVRHELLAISKRNRRRD